MEEEEEEAKIATSAADRRVESVGKFSSVQMLDRKLVYLVAATTAQPKYKTYFLTLHGLERD